MVEVSTDLTKIEKERAIMKTNIQGGFTKLKLRKKISCLSDKQINLSTDKQYSFESKQ